MDDVQKKVCFAMVNIFESSSVLGRYGAIGGLKNDKGHLSYGRSQVSLSSGHLYLLIKAYCEASDAQFGAELTPYLQRLGDKDITLDEDLNLRNILRQAGQDPAMQRVQDAYLDRNFFQPALAAAKAAGLQQPLSQAMAYDAHIQGGWATCSHLVNTTLGSVGATVSEEKWIAQYLETRTAYLKRVTNPDTSYRMVAYGTVVGANNWSLTLPFTFRGVSITEQSLGTSTPTPEPAAPVAPIPDPQIDNLPLLRPQIPYTRGAGVLNLQKLLNSIGLKNSQDAVYGPFTQALVSAFQKSKGMKNDAVCGPQTWTALMKSPLAAS
jgi:chitosanase